MSNLDPDSCAHCGVSWIKKDVEIGPPLPPKVVLVLDDPQYYRCEVCGATTELSIWNHGYKPEFLAEVFIRGFDDGPKSKP